MLCALQIYILKFKCLKPCAVELLPSDTAVFKNNMAYVYSHGRSRRTWYTCSQPRYGRLVHGTFEAGSLLQLVKRSKFQPRFAAEKKKMIGTSDIFIPPNTPSFGTTPTTVSKLCINLEIKHAIWSFDSQENH